MAKRTNRLVWRLVVALIGVVVASCIIYGQQTGRFTCVWRPGPPEWSVGIQSYITRQSIPERFPREQLVGVVYGLGFVDLTVRYKNSDLFLVGHDQYGIFVFRRFPK
jgi:hypothetical protein